jgi:predicted TIM-barrel fold metal-dependent hydrolase
MAKFPVIDADGHLIDLDSQLRKYLSASEARWTQRFAFFPFDGWDRGLGGTMDGPVHDAAAWLRALDSGGMEASVLFPTRGLFIPFVKDPEWASALCRAYNRMAHEEYVKASPRLKAVALLPVHDPELAAAELRRAVTEYGMVGGMLAADGDHLLGHRRFRPLYEEAQRLGTVLAVHGAGTHLGGAGVELFPKFLQAHAVSHPFAQMRQITSIVLEGIPELYPRLKLGFFEAGVTWLPYWMWRLDEEYEKRGAVEAPLLRRKPSEYIRGGNFYFTCEPDETILPAALAAVGEDQVMYASDFPHWDHGYPGSIEELAERHDLTEAQKRKILADNARRLYGLT